MGPRQQGETDCVGVFLESGLGHLLRCLEQARVNDLEAGVPQDPGDHFDAAIVAVEARLGHYNPIAPLHRRRY